MSSNEDPELPGRLAGLRRRGDGFRAPDAAYFEQLADRSLAAGKQPARSVGISRRWLGLAATLVVLVVAAFLLRPAPVAEEAPVTANATPASEALLADIDAADIEAYIADNLDNFDTEFYVAEASNTDF